MRRSELKRSAGLRRSGGGLSRRNGIKPVTRAAYDGLEWRRRVFEMHGAVCPCGRPASAAHHVCSKQALRRALPAEVFAVAVMDPRNGLPLCEWCHGQHHAALPRLGRDVLRWCHREFAVELGLGWLLDREYDERLLSPETKRRTQGEDSGK